MDEKTKPTVLKGGKSTKKGDELTATEVYRNIRWAMNNGQFSHWPKFERTFHTLADLQGRKYIVEEMEDRVVKKVDESAVVDAIADYCEHKLTGIAGTDFHPDQQTKCFQLWKRLKKPIEIEPVAVAEKSDVRLTYHRLHFDAVVEPSLVNGVWTPKRPEIEPEVFFEFLSRCSQGEALAAWLGSLFYAESDRQQYCYLYGEGEDGKGSFLRFLRKLFGHSFASLQPPKDNDKFWTSNLIGKRVVSFPDCANASFPKTGMFKQLTGEDPVFVEEKGKAGFTIDLNCKFIFSSNEKPFVSGQKSDMRRLIYVHVAKFKGGVIPKYEEKLWAEAELIVRWCKYHYLCLAKDHGPILVKEAEDLASENEEEAIEMFHRHFHETPGGRELASDINDVWAMEKILDTREMARIKAVWNRRFGIAYKVVFEDKVSRRYYLGLTRKQASKSKIAPGFRNEPGQ